MKTKLKFIRFFSTTPKPSAGNVRTPSSWKSTRASVSPGAAWVANAYLTRILTAQVYEVAHETPMQYAPNLSALLGNKVYLKREDTQPVFSFKIRGAFNKIASLSGELRHKGVVTCSAGNHAQGVALSANRLEIQATIVMPLATPNIKVDAVRRFGGRFVNVVLHGQNYDEAAAEARRRVMEEGLTLVHPFDDPDVIAGQGTIGMEIVKALNSKQLDVVYVCVGGGGMLAGIAAYLKALRPDVRIIGVEADDAAGMTASLQTGSVVTLSHVGLFADGAAVRTVGSETFRVCNELVDEMVTVCTDEICAAIKHGFNETRCVMEPAGALAIAGMKKHLKENGWVNKTCVAITSGANIDFDRLRFVSERADFSETLVSVTIPERPGAFRELYALLHPRRVTEFSYRHGGDGATSANIFVSFQAKEGASVPEDKEFVLAALNKKGFKVVDFSQNELAKAHARYLSGGRAALKTHTELLYRFEFPEAPGALSKFLQTIPEGWNISMWHYRNCGHDIGRVLVGIIINPEDKESFNTFLTRLGYTYYEETDNTAYLQFLR